MVIPTVVEQISLPSEDVRGSLESSPLVSSPDSPHGPSPVSELLDSLSIPAICTDVNVVPEHEKNELEQSILNLEGTIFNQLELREVIVFINQALQKY